MKKLLTLTFATFMFLNINAQMRPSQGVLFLGVGADPFSIISQSINDMDGGTLNYDVDKNTITQFNLNTEVGYFVSDGFAIGLGLNLESTTSIYEQGSYDTQLDSTQYTIAPFIRYHFGESGVFAEVAYQLGSRSSKYESDNYDSESDPTKTNGFAVGAGYAININDMLSINPSIYYSSLTTVLEDAVYDMNTGGLDDLEIKYSNIGFMLGVNLYLGY
ncbi:MAG: outer membrane beta-barrel protein [Bacteroidota bacterium]|nr:outer membrane beta-barrel protein [Bacteroidota bacterium]